MTLNGIKEIRWSSEVGFMRGSHFWSAFQSNSYAARVEFEDGFVTVVALPDGTASKYDAGDPELVTFVENEARSHHKTHKIAFPEGR